MKWLRAARAIVMIPAWAIVIAVLLAALLIEASWGNDDDWWP